MESRQERAPDAPNMAGEPERGREAPTEFLKEDRTNAPREQPKLTKRLGKKVIAASIKALANLRMAAL